MEFQNFNRDRAKTCAQTLTGYLKFAARYRGICGIGKHSVSPNYRAEPCFVTSVPLLSGLSPLR